MTTLIENEVRPAEVQQLAELLEFQDSSIVSRVLLKNKGGTVTFSPSMLAKV
jgi:hypothetical protein